MRLRLPLYCLCCALLLACSVARKGPAALAALVLADSLLVPEGIAAHPDGRLFVSSLYRRGIVEIAPDGRQRTLPVPGFRAGLGLKVSADGRSLWACSAEMDAGQRPLLVRYDLQEDRLAATYTHDSALFFNDLALHPDGTVYLTDTYRGAVFRLLPGGAAPEPWLRNAATSLANGIALSGDGRLMYVASGDNGIQRIDLATGAFAPLGRSRTDYAVDGLLWRRNELLAVIGWPHDRPETHRVLRLRLDNKGFFERAETLLVNDPRLNAPTTATLRGDTLLVLGRTNLPLFNRHGARLALVRDSLQPSLVLRLPLSKP